MTKINVILPCGGQGKRANLGFNKLFYPLAGVPIVCKTISAFCRPDINKIIISCAQDDRIWFEQNVMPLHCNIVLCDGGTSRSQSVFNALSHLDNDCDFVAIHDGARPFVTQKIIDDCIALAKQKGNAVTVISCVDSLRHIDKSGSKVVDREEYVCCQTPQIFKTDEIKFAYSQAILQSDMNFSDDASVYEKFVGKIFLSQGDTINKKITTKSDLNYVTPSNYFVGIGWDTHELVEGRKLILGGIEISHTKGLLGHSDADVLTHAIMDCLLSASNNRDIGYHFPDTDCKYSGISSMLLLEYTKTLLESQGFVIINISANIMAQKPKLKDYILVMQSNLCNALNLDNSRVSLTATTTEKLGLIGHEQAISCQAICGIQKQN